MAHAALQSLPCAALPHGLSMSRSFQVQRTARTPRFHCFFFTSCTWRQRNGAARGLEVPWPRLHGTAAHVEGETKSHEDHLAPRARRRFLLFESLGHVIKAISKLGPSMQIHATVNQESVAQAGRAPFLHHKRHGKNHLKQSATWAPETHASLRTLWHNAHSSLECSGSSRN